MMERYRKAMEELTLRPEADAKIRHEIFCAQTVRSAPKRNDGRKRPVRVMAAVAAVLLLAVTGYAVSGKIRMEITRDSSEEQKVSVTFEEPTGGEDESGQLKDMIGVAGQTQSVYEAQYSFPKEAPGTYIELGYWLPEWIPAGYEQTFVSDRAYGSQTVLYGNEAGNEIRYEYAKPSGFGGVTMYGVVSEETVQIGESEGVLFRKTVGSSLFWLREADGIGFWLSTDDPAVDLVEMARSVAACEPFRSEEADAQTVAAINQLGDFSLTWLPEGFEKRDTAGCPIPEDGWYGYVRIFYTDKSTNREAVLSYEPFSLPPEAAGQDPAEYFRSLHNEEAHVNTVIEEVSVNGLVGMVHVSKKGNAVYWLDAENGLQFLLSSTHLTVEELLQMAESTR